MSKLLLLVGCSASGKTTLANDLESKYGLKSIPSYTTRQPRTPDEKGHTFVTDEEFNRLENIIAYAETTGGRYCVTQQMFDDPQYTVYVIDNSGIKYLKENYKGNREFVVAYITAPLRERFDRMVQRSVDKDDPVGFALERIEHDAVEFRDVPYDIRIENNNGNYNEALAALYMFCQQEGVYST